MRAFILGALTMAGLVLAVGLLSIVSEHTVPDLRTPSSALTISVCDLPGATSLDPTCPMDFRMTKC